MNKIELRELLHQEYKSENWKKITEFVFPNVSYLQKPQDIPIKNYDGIVESFKQLGNVKLNDGKNLAMFEVRVSESVNIPYNRVKLRSLVAPFIDQEHNHGVLVIYEQGKENYRFTFTAKSTEFDEEKGDFVNRETDSKRYTYVLGKNESCRTAADRFFDLAGHKNEADINAVQEAFSVEKLSKQFFKEYKEHYEKFVGYLMASTSYHTAIFKSDDKAIRDFVKLLLGRLVFIQFVQKKRWMGVPPKDDGWHNGELDFLFGSFKNFHNKSLFYSHFLEPLFYETLSKPNRPNDIFSITGTKVPFLNGGLFEKEETDTSLVNFPEPYFYDILEFFDKYNFTINEYDPIDHEVGIDPEMLGSIFENLLEDNKDKGAYYTPKEIVHYMSQESLKEYLKTYLHGKKSWPENDESEKALESFVKKKEAGGVIDFDEILATALRDVKICDPAIGSGAFPMGLLNEIYHCVYVLYNASPDVVGEVWKMDKWAPDVVKKNIIQNSIYGVDIEKGAVDIARLRFWLSLIIDELEPHALPNLDYKIVVGNSLVSKLGNDIIDIDWNLKEGAQTEMFGNANVITSKILLEKITKEQKDFFNPESDKAKLAKDIRKLKIELLITQFELMIKSSNQETEPKVSNFKDMKKFVLATELYHKTLGWKNSIAKLKKIKNYPDKTLHFFDWKLDFPEVMNKEVSTVTGFDIVIGNPPYVSAVTMARDGETKKFFKEKYPMATGSYDLYLLFLLKGLELSCAKGIYTWIIPNKFLIADYAKKTKSELIENNGLKYSINVSKFNVFDGIGVYPIILFGNKKNKSEFSELLLKKYDDLENRIFLQPKTLKAHKTFKSFGIEINSGATGFQAQELKDIISNKKNKGSIPFAVSGNIDRYFWTNESVRYMGERYTTAFINNSSNIVALSKSNFWNKPKIVIAGMTKRIEAVYVEEPLGLGVGIYGIHNFGGLDPYCLTAILNSKYLTYYFLIKFKDKHLAGGYLAINKSTIEEFPLVDISKKSQRKLSSLSIKVHDLISNKKSSDEIENEIDTIVYKIYDLDFKEVTLIDPEFALNEEEYSLVKIE